jgi:hypothetical protein
MMVWPRRQEAGGSWSARLGADLDEGPGLVATQMLMFLLAGAGGPAVAAGRLADAHGVAAGDGRLIRAGLAGHGR